eukprot:4646417-Prymnesium_polylepis.1
MPHAWPQGHGVIPPKPTRFRPLSTARAPRLHEPAALAAPPPGTAWHAHRPPRPRGEENYVQNL